MDSFDDIDDLYPVDKKIDGKGSEKDKGGKKAGGEKGGGDLFDGFDDIDDYGKDKGEGVAKGSGEEKNNKSGNEMMKKKNDDFDMFDDFDFVNEDAGNKKNSNGNQHHIDIHKNKEKDMSFHKESESKDDIEYDIQDNVSDHKDHKIEVDKKKDDEYHNNIRETQKKEQEIGKNLHNKGQSKEKEVSTHPPKIKRLDSKESSKPAIQKPAPKDKNKEPNEKKETGTDAKELSISNNAKPPASASQLRNIQLPESLQQYESDSAFISYYSNLTDFDRNRFMSLYDKNRRLREELLVIHKATEEIIKKEKDRRSKKDKYIEDEEIIKKRMIVEDQLQIISTMRSKISKKQKELDEAYQYPLIREREDVLRDLRRQIESLVKDRDGGLRVRRDENKGMQDYDNGKEEDRKESLMEELSEMKRESKSLMEVKADIEKQLEKNHNRLVNGRIQVREMEKRLEEYKTNKRKGDVSKKRVGREEVEEIRRELEEAKKRREEKGKEHEEEVREYERVKVEIRKAKGRAEKDVREKERDEGEYGEDEGVKETTKVEEDDAGGRGR